MTFPLQFNQLTSKFARISSFYCFSRMWQKETGYVSKRMFKIFLSHAMFFSLIFTRFCGFLKIFFSSLPSEGIDIVIIPISYNECDRSFLKKEHSEIIAEKTHLFLTLAVSLFFWKPGLVHGGSRTKNCRFLKSRIKCSILSAFVKS